MNLKKGTFKVPQSLVLTKNQNNESLIKYKQVIDACFDIIELKIITNLVSYAKLYELISLNLFDLVPKGIDVLTVITEFVFQHDKSLNAHISVYGQLNNKNLLFHFKQFKIAK